MAFSLFDILLLLVIGGYTKKGDKLFGFQVIEVEIMEKSSHA